MLLFVGHLSELWPDNWMPLGLGVGLCQGHVVLDGQGSQKFEVFTTIF